MGWKLWQSHVHAAALMMHRTLKSSATYLPKQGMCAEQTLLWVLNSGDTVHLLEGSGKGKNLFWFWQQTVTKLILSLH